MQLKLLNYLKYLSRCGQVYEIPWHRPDWEMSLNQDVQ
jgi:hypothetical protein